MATSSFAAITFLLLATFRLSRGLPSNMTRAVDLVSRRQQDLGRSSALPHTSDPRLPRVTTDFDIQKMLNWLKGGEAAAILAEIGSVPQFQALIGCAKRELRDMDAWETVAGLTNGKIVPRLVRATDPISIAQFLSDLLNKTGADRVVDTIRELIERNVDVRRITSLLDGPAWNYILDLLLNLPIFTVFRQNLKLDSDQNFQRISQQLRQMLSRNPNPKPICQTESLEWTRTS